MKHLPEKGKDIIGIDADGRRHECYRCACHNPKCKGWRCSHTGNRIINNIIHWEDIDMSLYPKYTQFGSLLFCIFSEKWAAVIDTNRPIVRQCNNVEYQQAVISKVVEEETPGDAFWREYRMGR